jgi:hypothetical protein
MPPSGSPRCGVWRLPRRAGPGRRGRCRLPVARPGGQRGVLPAPAPWWGRHDTEEVRAAWPLLCAHQRDGASGGGRARGQAADRVTGCRRAGRPLQCPPWRKQSQAPVCAASGFIVHSGRSEAREAAVATADAVPLSVAEVVGYAGDDWADEDLPMAHGGDVRGRHRSHLCVRRRRDVPPSGLPGTRRRCAAPRCQPRAARLPRRARGSTRCDAAVPALVAGRFTVEERMTLAVEVADAHGRCLSQGLGAERGIRGADDPPSVSSCSTSRSGTPRSRDARRCRGARHADGIDGVRLQRRGADPVPVVDAILLTPVAPHSLFNRTVVVDPGEALSVRPVG